MKKLDIPSGIFDIGKNNDGNNNSNVNGNIKITRKDFKETKIQVGWRLNASTVARIQELSFDSRMGISEFVQELLDKALKDIDIE